MRPAAKDREWAIEEGLCGSTLWDRRSDGVRAMKPEIHQEEGYRLMGAAFEAYNEQGYGLAEEIHHKDTLEWRRFILSEYIPTHLDQRRLA